MHDARAAAVEPVIRQLRDAGMDPVWVDRAPVYDRTTLLHALYQALHMPAWFGFNWDALADMLFGGDEEDETPRVLVFHDFELLEARDPETAAVFLDIVESVASNPDSTLRGMVRSNEIRAQH